MHGQVLVASVLAAVLFVGQDGAASADWPALAGDAQPSAASVPLTLRSAAFGAGQPIPVRYTCDGADLSPALAWRGVPGRTTSLALVVDDLDAHGFAHWLVYNLPAAATGLPAAVAPRASGPAQGVNDFGRRGYGGPCPPAGRHRYRFTLYALDRSLTFGTSPHKAQLLAAINHHLLSKVALVGTYARHS
jgi:Raf kinase inhibitor-like YbhB/YbcL family protein